jgi:uncharacterized membrane protein YeiH
LIYVPVEGAVRRSETLCARQDGVQPDPERAGLLLRVPDALGLDLLSMIGASSALQAQLSPPSAVPMGVVTGVFGGCSGTRSAAACRSVFRRNTELYATCSFVGTWVFVVLAWAAASPALATAAVSGTVVVLRLVSVRFELTLRAPSTRPARQR